MELIQAAWEGFTSSISSMAKIAMIVFPLMIVIEIGRDSGIMAKISRRFQFMAKPLSLSDQAVFPLLVGLVFGLSYGSGVIINAARQGNLTTRDRYGIALFLSICHALVEDTLLFAAIGANLGWVLSVRVFVPLLITPIIVHAMFDLTKERSANPSRKRLNLV